MHHLHVDGYHHLLFRALYTHHKDYINSVKLFDPIRKKIKRGDLTRDEKLKAIKANENIHYYQIHVWTFAIACSEATINLILCDELPPNDFQLLERDDLIKKWFIYPKLFAADYELSTDKGPGQLLKKIISKRNNVGHPKPLYVENDVTKHKGSMKQTPEDHTITVKAIDLPKLLFKHIEAYHPDISNLAYFLGLDQKDSNKPSNEK